MIGYGLAPGPSMPGEPIGMFGAERPTTVAGASLSSCRTTSAGTWPSITYLPMTAVWQERRLAGTFWRGATFSNSACGSISRSTPKLAACMWSAHLLQQPQVGVRYTLAATGASFCPVFAAAGFCA